MPFGRLPSRFPGLVMGALLLLAMLPAAAAAAATEQPRNYVVTLAVTNAEKTFKASSRSQRQRIRLRADRTEVVTDRLAATHGFRARHRFERTAPGFSARMTATQAAKVAQDEKVVSIRPARRFKLASQSVPRGVRRVKAAPEGSPGHDVDVDIAVLDTGIGPVGGSELNIAGGINCASDPSAPGYDPNDWTDSISSRHGTHVAGIAAARDNGIGTVGVAPGARLWAVRVFEGPFGDEATIVCGLQWAISTHDGASAPPGTQPIDVINMSLQGPRGAVVEACPGAADDLMHRAICEAVDAGITVVVAAGNNSSSTRRISPAGYDQVITVGALSDFDGLGGGEASSDCEFYKKEVDDSYSRYSNFGSDVDIVAPGTCVVSTNVGDGSTTRTLTGTSMASPHVAGAVARYLAAHPSTSPERMRKLVRASGRMDWDPKSDKRWSGVTDTDEPNRVLDVKALMGPEDVRVWLFRDRFKVGVDDTKRTTRVDVQRAGGYDGQVKLGVDGLPGAVGSSAFDTVNLSGLSGLGTTIRLALKTAAPDGVYAFDVEADGPGGNPSGARSLNLTIDRSGPVIAKLGVRARAGRAALAATGATQAFVGWDVSDALSRVTKVTLQRKIGGQPWNSLGTQKGSTTRTIIKPGQSNRFRVIARDGRGNKTTSAPFGAQLMVRDSGSPMWVRPASGGWHTKKAGKALGGSLLMANKPAESLATSFRATAFAVVAPVGPGRGKVRIRLDGGAWQVVSLNAARAGQQRVVFSRRVDAGSHDLEIEGFKGQTAIDALLIIR